MSSDTYSIKPFSAPNVDLAPAADFGSAASLAPAVDMSTPSVAVTSGGHNWWKYLLIVAILGLLMLLLFVYFARKYIPDLSLIYELLGAYAGGKATSSTDKNAETTVQPKTADTQTATTDYKKNDESANEHPDMVAVKPTRENVYVPEPIPDEAGSRTQSTKATSKAGFCYIGEDRGFRSCIKVGEGDKCMSGDIFPTEAICINPNLRE